MRTLDSLDERALTAALRDGRLCIQTGLFHTVVSTRESIVHAGLRRLYARNPIVLDPEFADYHIEVARVPGLRRWVRPQVTFRMDGVEPFKPLPAEQAFAMFEWGLNWCVASMAHRWMMLHSAVLARDGHAIVLPAPPGSGKSTLCAALAFHGWRLLSDEIVVLDPHSDEVWPLARPINVKNQSIDVVRAFLPQALVTKPVNDTKKGTVAHIAPPATAVAGMNEPAQVKWVVFPKWERGVATSFEPLTSAEVFAALVENAFNYDVQGEDGFAALTRIAIRAHGFRFTYSDLSEAVRAFGALE